MAMYTKRKYIKIWKSKISTDRIRKDRNSLLNMISKVKNESTVGGNWKWVGWMGGEDNPLSRHYLIVCLWDSQTITGSNERMRYQCFPGNLAPLRWRKTHWGHRSELRSLGKAKQTQSGTLSDSFPSREDEFFSIPYMEELLMLWLSSGTLILAYAPPSHYGQ